MKTDNLFNESVPMLRNLPEVPKILWYVSAGNDFRSLSFLSSYNREHQMRHHKRELPRPDLFVFNSLGRESDHLFVDLLSQRRPILFQDEGTQIVASGFQELTLTDEIEEQLQISTRYIHFAEKYIQREKTRVYCFKVTVSGQGYSDSHTVLYFEHENIDFFNKIILSHFFEVQYLCATREGLGFGGCGKSIVEHIYNDANPDFYTSKGFMPEFLILFGEGDQFAEAVAENPYFTYIKDYVWYPGELGERWKDSSVCKLD